MTLQSSRSTTGSQVVTTALNSNPLALQHAAAEFKEDEQLVMGCVRAAGTEWAHSIGDGESLEDISGKCVKPV